MLTVITGPDSFLVRAEIDRIKSRHDPDGLNTSTFEANAANLDEIVAALGTPGFFGGCRIIVVFGLMSRSAKQSMAGLDSDEEPERTGPIEWPRVFAAILPANVVVLADRGLSTIPAVVKKALPHDAIAFEGNPPRGSGLVSWIKQRVTAANSQIGDMNARLLAESLCPSTWTGRPSNPAYDRPPDLEQLSNEIEKLAMAAYPGAIERTHILEMTAAEDADRLFPLIDAVFAADAKASVNELASALGNGNDAGRLVAQLCQQTELLAALDTAGRMDPVEAGRQLGLSNPNRMHAVAKSLRRVRDGTRPLATAALATERQFKSGVLRHPADQVYVFVDRVLTRSGPTRDGGTQ